MVWGIRVPDAIGKSCVQLIAYSSHLFVTITWGRKPPSSSLPTDRGQSWELAYRLELKCRKYHSRSGGFLRRQSTSRSAALEQHGKAWGSQRSLADKISAHSDQGPRDQEDLSAGSLHYCTTTAFGLIPDAITLYAPLVYLTDVCIYS